MTINNNESVTIVYIGEINRNGYEKITKVCEELGENRAETVDLVLSTYGGDPDAGFRIARCLQHYFENGINLYVPHYCKSAGTLIAIGAKELILSDRGELGPLDVQLINSNEMFERSSGMDITQGFNVLTSQAYNMFHNITVNLKRQSRLSTKIATESASQITVGSFSPIFAQIDPVKLGEIERATEIAYKYGELLREKYDNIDSNGINKLVAGYPSHGFVIDRKEARSIFKTVRSPDPEEVTELGILDELLRKGVSLSDVICIQITPEILEDLDSRENTNEDAKNGTHTTKQTGKGNETTNSDDIPDSKEPKKCN